MQKSFGKIYQHNSDFLINSNFSLEELCVCTYTSQRTYTMYKIILINLYMAILVWFLLYNIIYSIDIYIYYAYIYIYLAFHSCILSGSITNLHSLFKSETNNNYSGNSIFLALWRINQKSITFTRTQCGRCWPYGHSLIFFFVHIYVRMCLYSPTDWLTLFTLY